jgi:hypothetical protein
MASLNQILPWITLGIVVTIVISLGIFYITRLIKNHQELHRDAKDSKLNDLHKKAALTVLAKEQLKKEIVHDILADLTPALKSRVEKSL